MYAPGLPFVDEYEIDVAAAPEVVWAATIRTLTRSFAGSGDVVAHALGCASTTASDWSRPAPGCTLPGFEAEVVESPTLLRLSGRHRFSEYALTFRIDEISGGRRCRAETRARFPGLRGRLYRTAVIGSRGHRVAVRRMLGTVQRLAEREPS